MHGFVSSYMIDALWQLGLAWVQLKVICGLLLQWYMHSLAEESVHEKTLLPPVISSRPGWPEMPSLFVVKLILHSYYQP
jgi:hypothetical protein